MIPKIIHQCWFGPDPIPDEHKKCMESIRRHMPDYDIRLWGNDDLPDCLFVRACLKWKKYAFLSEYMRLQMLERDGGIYLDTDVEVFKSFDDLLDNACFLGLDADDKPAPNAVIGAVPGHHFVTESMDMMTKGINRRMKPYYDAKVKQQFLQGKGNANAERQRIGDVLAFDNSVMSTYYCKHHLTESEQNGKARASAPSGEGYRVSRSLVVFRAKLTGTQVVHEPVKSNSRTRQVNVRPHQVRFRLYGAAVKLWARIYHAFLPKKRFIMPDAFPAECFPGDESLQKIPRIVWQTNFTEKCSLPVWLNYRMNRKMARGYEFRYVSTEARDAYMKEHADARTYRAYCRLTDGAAQADLWRIVQLYNDGGIYLDIDACLINPLWKLLEGKEQLWIAAHGYRATNYFLATVPGNPVFREYLENVLDRIENYPKGEGPSVYYVTGPGALCHIISRHGIMPIPRNLVCQTGAIVNERFQYIDRPRSKWTYRKTFIK